MNKLVWALILSFWPVAAFAQAGPFGTGAPQAFSGAAAGDLIYSAQARCRCGRGLAFPKALLAQPNAASGAWQCSGVLRGICPPNNGHHGPYNFSTVDYSSSGLDPGGKVPGDHPFNGTGDGSGAPITGIMSEVDSSAISNGLTTRPSGDQADDNIDAYTQHQDDCCKPDI
jgi:hypothetical protein